MSSGKSHRNRREELFRRLDVDAEKLALQPQIAPLLRMNGILPERLVEVLRCDVNQESMMFVEAWRNLTPAQRHLAGLEAVAASVGLLPRRLWELFAGAALVQANESVAVMIAMALPEVMRTTIKGAKKSKGISDREHLLKAARVLPTPKGSVTNINLPGAEKTQEIADGEGKELEDMGSLLRSLQSAPVRQLPSGERVE